MCVGTTRVLELLQVNKTYLGDAVYAENVNGDIVLTTENGIEVTNRIVLEYDVFTALLRWKAMVDKASLSTG